MIAGLLAGVLALPSSVFAAPEPPAPGDAGSFVAKKLSDADMALKSGNGTLAAIHLKNALRVAPHNPELHLRLGLLFLEMGDTSGAEHEIRQARADGAKPEVGLPALFQVMLARGEPQTLLSQFPDPGDAVTPQAIEILKGRALAFQSMGNLTQATDAIDRSLKLSRGAGALLVRARIALLQGDTATAKSFADEILNKAPDNLDAVLFKIELLRSTRQTAAALALANQYAAKFPNSLPFRFARIEIFLSGKQDKDAKGEVDDILAKDPALPNAVYYRAVLQARTGDAKAALGTAQTLPPEFLENAPSMTFRIAEIAQAAGRLDTASSVLSSLLAKQPGNAEARVRLALIRRAQNSPYAALQALEPIKDSSDPVVIRLLAQTYSDLDRKDDAQKVLSRLKPANSASANPTNSKDPSKAEPAGQSLQKLSPLAAKEPTNAAVVLPYIAALIQAKRLPEALAAADRLGGDPKQRVSALVYRGQILLLQNNMAGAKAAFDKAVTLEPNNKQALSSRASLLLAGAKYDEAAGDFRAILSADPTDVDAPPRLAQIAARQGKDAEVRAILAKAITANPRATKPRMALMTYLAGRQELKEALKVSDDYIRLPGADAQGRSVRGQIQSALGQKKEAIETFRQVALQDPKSAAAQLRLGDALFAAGDRAGAEAAFNTAARYNPALPEVKRAQINLLAAEGKTDAAIALARSFQYSSPGPAADLMLADTLAAAKRGGEAADILTKSLAKRPDRTVLIRLASLHLQAGDSSSATALLSHWLEKNPNDLAVRIELGNYLILQNNLTAAVPVYEKILAQEPNNVPAMGNLAWALQDRDPKRALSILAKASQMAPDSAEVADSLGWISFRQKDIRTGLQYLQRAHVLRPNDGEITYHLAVVLDANSQHDEARKILESLLASKVPFADQAAANQLAAAWR